MASVSVLIDLGLVVSAAAGALLLARPLRLPPMLAYMGVGIVLGPVAGLLEVGESIELFSELGVALLLFLVGLELSLDRVRDVGAQAVGVGLAQVGLTTLLGWGLARGLGFGGPDAILLGLVTAFSSTVVVVKLLDRSGDVGSLHGRLAIGILLVQDVVIAVVLTILSGLGSGGGVPDLAAAGRGLAGAGAGIAALVVVAIVGARWLLPRFLRWLADSPEPLLVVALTWCFGFILLAEAVHVSIELGAFVAGVSLAQQPTAAELERRVHPLVDFFLAVFFVTLGTGLDPAAMPSVWGAALAVSALVLVMKPALIAVLLGRRVGGRCAFLTGLTLGQISEFAFVLVGLAVGAGLVTDARLVPLVGTVGLITIGGSALLVPYGPSIAGRLLSDARGRERDAPAAQRSGHVVVVGMNTLGWDLVRRFTAAGLDVVAVDTDPAKLALADAPSVHGDANNPAVLDAADVPTARLLVSTLQIEDVNALLVHRCRTWDVPVSVHAFDTILVAELLELGADHVMISKLDAAELVETELRRIGVFG